jgi:hypothetical protein
MTGMKRRKQKSRLLAQIAAGGRVIRGGTTKPFLAAEAPEATGLVCRT